MSLEKDSHVQEKRVKQKTETPRTFRHTKKRKCQREEVEEKRKKGVEKGKIGGVSLQAFVEIRGYPDGTTEHVGTCLCKKK
jgi:hypothetical protein